MKKISLFFVVIGVLFLLPSISIAQVSNVRKTITFNSITLPPGSCYIDKDLGVGYGCGTLEDPGIIINCTSSPGSPTAYNNTWCVDIATAGTFNLTVFNVDCPASTGSSFSIDPVNILVVSSVNLYVYTFERDNNGCSNSNQSCTAQGAITFNLNVGSYSFTQGQITYNYTVTQGPSTTPSNFCSLALPIELTQFDVIPYGNHAELNWQTSSERNNDYFTIERSIDGVSWEERMRIKGAGNSTNIINYRELDENRIIGISYYRLKQTDFDGAFSYSDIKSYRSEITDEINVYPNPVFSNTLNLSGKDLSRDALRIYDLYGRDVTHQVLVIDSESGFALDVSEIQAGNYFLSTGSTVVKFSKQ